jgi:hypothetical protein
MWSSPLVVGATLGWLFVEWILIVALGYPGPIAPLAHVSAVPPLSTLADLYVSTGILGIRTGLFLVVVVGAVHALWLSLMAGWAVEVIESGTATRWGAVRGLRAFPVAIALHVVGVAVLFASQFVAAIGGLGLSLFIQIAIVVIAVWAVAFAPVIAVAEGRRLTDCLGRSLRAARLPGSGNLTFAALYVIPMFATFGAPGVPGALLDVNPPPSAWIFVVLVNLLHGAVLAAFAMRYLAVAAEVPEAPARPSRITSRGTASGSQRGRRGSSRRR